MEGRLTVVYIMLKSRHTHDEKKEVGIDEAGRGCLWGPLMAAAVVWPEEADWTEEIREISGKIRDSKKISPKRRTVLEAQIKQHAVAWSVGAVTANEIDTLGMTKSNRLAFQRALDGISAPYGRLLIDGTLGLLGQDGIEQHVEPKGDDTYIAIAAASILAKEGRDSVVRGMCDADETLESRYSILCSKGYGTLKHRTAIKEYGMHAEHRRLFLRKLLGLEHKVSQECGFIDD
jgi:ribonuclease HII